MKKEIISRTVKTVKASALYLDENRKLIEVEVDAPNRFDTAAKIENYLRKSGPCPDGWRFVGVDDVHTIEQLRGMYIDDFLRYARPVVERSKETRDCVTKEIIMYVSVYEYLDDKRAIAQDMVIIPSRVADSVEAADKYIRKNVTVKGRFIGTIKIRKGSAIYALDEAEFNRLSKPMLDRFHIQEDGEQ